MKRIISTKKIFSTVILSAGLLIAPLFMFNTETQAQDNLISRNVNLKYNGVFSDSDVPAVLYDSRTLVPLRFIAESTGAKVDWHNDERMVTIDSKDKNIKLKIDDENVTVNDVPSKIDYGVPPKLINSNTMVPLRFISDLLDANVEWYNDSNTASVVYPKKYHGEGEVPEDQKSAIDTLINGTFLNLNKVNVKFDSQPFKAEFPSILYTDKTMVSLRELGNKVGMEVIWNQVDKSITLSSDKKKIVLQIGSDIATINGIPKNIGATAKPLLVANPEGAYYTMVPIRFITEELGYSLEWSQTDTSVNIVENKNKKVSLTNAAVNSDGTSEFIELYLNNISSPVMDHNGEKVSEFNLTIPNGGIDIEGVNSFAFNGGGIIKSVKATENADSSINVNVVLNNESTVSSRYYGNNLVLQLTENSIPELGYSVIYTPFDLSFEQMVLSQISNSKPTTDAGGGGFRPANASQVRQALTFNSNVELGSVESFKFLDLSKPSGISAAIFNKALEGKGILRNQGNSFVTASQTHGVNDAYLVAHSVLETGNGSSTLANGVWVTHVNGKAVTPKIVYNMFGIGAKDSDAVRLGAERAYQEGWFSPEEAIIGGAKFIGEQYVNRPGNIQNTIYEMRWNPMSKYRWHQYASDIGWANKQANNIKKYYDMAGSNYNLHFDIPVYR